VSQVDLPCSGVKSLWTGMLFLLAATWLERRPLNLRWLLLAFSFAAFLIIANLVRVGVLVTVGPVAGWLLLAEMLHVPLGVLGFVVACTAAVGLLRLSPPRKESGRFAWTLDVEIAPASREMSTLHAKRPNPNPYPLSHISHPTSPIPVRSLPLEHPPWLGPALVVVILTMVLVYTPRPQTGLAQPPPAWEFPAGLITTPMPLKPDEIAWFTRDGAESAVRRRFEWHGLTGSMILITSSTWRAHHRPERCFEVYGLSLEGSHTHLINPNFPVRFVALGDSNHSNLLSATYWFQSAGRTTDDYGTRLWADLALQHQSWVLVSILFDGVTEPGAAQVEMFYLALHEAVAHYLEGETR
jgi:exosortase/archaeosortase family protein